MYVYTVVGSGQVDFNSFFVLILNPQLSTSLVSTHVYRDSADEKVLRSVFEICAFCTENGKYTRMCMHKYCSEYR